MNAGRLFLVAALAVGVAYVAARRLAPGVAEFEASIVTGLSNTLGELLARFEGFSATPYRDQAGLWTIGYGHLIVPGDGFYHPDHDPEGRTEISVQEAKDIKAIDAQTAIDAVERCVFADLTENQRNALVSLAYNIGAGAFCSSSLVKALNGGDYTAAANWFMVWNKIKDPMTGELVASAGLTYRRKQEQELFLT